jgi:hypothetical protein
MNAQAEYLSTGAVARCYGYSSQEVCRWISEGRDGPLGRTFLKAFRFGERCHWRTTAAWVEEFLRALNGDVPAIAAPVRQIDAQARRDQAEADRLLNGKKRRKPR